MMFHTIWYHLYNFKEVKNTHGGVLLLVKLQTFLRFLNCTNSTKSRNATQLNIVTFNLAYWDQNKILRRLVTRCSIADQRPINGNQDIVIIAPHSNIHLHMR